MSDDVWPMWLRVAMLALSVFIGLGIVALFVGVWQEIGR